MIRRSPPAAGLAMPLLVRAQGVPERRIRYLRSVPPGTTNDKVARTMARAARAVAEAWPDALA